MAEASLLAPEKFPIVYEGGEPTAVLVDIATFRRMQFVLDNLQNREPEPEDAVIAASDWLKNVLKEIEERAEPSEDWERELGVEQKE